ncbi:M1 family metallopeptidase [Neptunicella sp.]|uniref:M1 family metallopeptidase n=1 Tax=Neptunicella sp. TaxID=2125986 RepID=UPI003F693926
MIKRLIPHLYILMVSTLFYSISAAAQTEYRLPVNIKPEFQQVSLKVDPDQLDYSGNTVIDINVTSPTDKIGFYQIDLSIDKIELVQGDKHTPLSVTQGDYNINWATSASTIPAGKYQLQIAFSGKVNTSSDGMYLAQFEDKNYIYTQFEDMHARRAFPSFDEPSFKIPFQLTISSPEKNTVLSNTQVAKRTVKNGWQTVVFNKTKPMPSYIVAYAIGEFDSAPIEGLSVPGHIYTAKGQAGKTKFIAKHTAEIVKALESYFGMDYPFEKIDFIAVPNFTHGAMENAGLITFRSSYLLLDDQPSLTDKAGPLSVVAHELAHMWYGNLVTMAWWDDLWLNEAFASWMAGKVMVNLYPELNTKNDLVQEGAFPADASPTTRPIKKQVRSAADVMDGLGLNYSKGESILLMIESLIGEQAFQQGIQKYIKQRSWKNAEANDLWHALATVSDIDLPAMMKTYIEQPGYALLSFDENGKVTQQRYLLTDEGNKNQVWQIPLSIKYKQNGQVKNTTFTLTDQQDVISKISEAEWIFPDSGALGYFRWKTSVKQLDALLKDIDVLSGKEKKSLVYNVGALFSANQISLVEYFKALTVLANAKEPMVVAAVFSAIDKLDYLVDDSNRHLYATYIEKMAMPWFNKLGTTEQAGESDELVKLRYTILGLLTSNTDNQQVLDISTKLTKSYLADPHSVPNSIASRAMTMVARHGDAQWYNKFEQAYIAHTDARVRSTINRGFAFKQDKLLQRYLDFSLQSYVTPANVIASLYRGAAIQDNKDLFYQWMEKHFTELTQKMPAYHVGHLPEYTGSTCNQQDIDSAKTFYKDRMQQFDGMARSYEVAMQRSQQCVELKDKNQPAFNQYLKQQ